MWQPVLLLQTFAEQLDAIRHDGGTVIVVSTAAAGFMKIAATHTGIKNLPGLGVFQLVQATLGTAIAQRLPLRL